MCFLFGAVLQAVKYIGNRRSDCKGALEDLLSKKATTIKSGSPYYANIIPYLSDVENVPIRWFIGADLETAPFRDIFLECMLAYKKELSGRDDRAGKILNDNALFGAEVAWIVAVMRDVLGESFAPLVDVRGLKTHKVSQKGMKGVVGNYDLLADFMSSNREEDEEHEELALTIHMPSASDYPYCPDYANLNDVYDLNGN